MTDTKKVQCTHNIGVTGKDCNSIGATETDTVTLWQILYNCSRKRQIDNKTNTGTDTVRRKDTLMQYLTRGSIL